MDKQMMHSFKKIAIFRALQLGDMLCAIPAIRAFKAAYPQTAITLIGLPWARDFIERYPAYFSDFIPFPGAPGLPEQPYDADLFIQYLKLIKEEAFDLVIQMQGNGLITNPLVAMSEAGRVAGYCGKGLYCPDEETFMPYPEDLPEIKRHLLLMKFLGAASQGEHLEFPALPEEETEYAALAKEVQLQPQQYVCVHPGARDIKRWWPPEKFAAVANEIADRGYQIVFTGTIQEAGVIEEALQYMRFPAVNLVDRTSLGVLALLIKNARMLLSNDTGVSHVATAMKTPSVVIFLTSEPARWGPLDRERHFIILPEESENIEYVKDRAMQMLQWRCRQERETDKVPFKV